MSKLDMLIQQYLERLVEEYDCKMMQVKFAKMPVDQALNQQLLQPSIALMMQHVGFSLGFYSIEYVVTEQWSGDDSVLIVCDWDDATPEQQHALVQYYDTKHPRLTRASREMTAFLLYCSIRGALFIGMEPIDRPLIYPEKTITLDYSVVVLNVLATTVGSLVRPNQTVHNSLRHSVASTLSTEPNHDHEIESTSH
ncbi:hypothetical protein KW429_11015 [Vibrio fluvialis]|nr:hypothetical protein [Vibrio fluvialis]MBY7902383.1 hypothetical protein [Vibrio fluvialis]